MGKGTIPAARNLGRVGGGDKLRSEMTFAVHRTATCVSRDRSSKGCPDVVAVTEAQLGQSDSDRGDRHRPTERDREDRAKARRAV